MIIFGSQTSHSPSQVFRGRRFNANTLKWREKDVGFIALSFVRGALWIHSEFTFPRNHEASVFNNSRNHAHARTSLHYLADWSKETGERGDGGGGGEGAGGFISETLVHKCAVHVRANTCEVPLRRNLGGEKFAKLRRHHSLRRTREARRKRYFFAERPWDFAGGRISRWNFICGASAGMAQGARTPYVRYTSG